jgi:two-component system, NtrC family, response regulator HydG
MKSRTSPDPAEGAPRPLVLCVDDDATERRLLALTFGIEGFDVESAENGASALRRVEDESARRPDVVILDVRLPDIDGLSVLRRLRQSCPDLPVVMLTGCTDVKTALDAIQLGAFHFLTKPVDGDELVVTVRRALERRVLIEELVDLRARVADGEASEGMLGRSPAMQALRDAIRRVAATDVTVLVQGETGVGKELVARAIHDASARRGATLVAIDCGAVTETLAESELFGHERGAFSGADRRREGHLVMANGGTVFLDEIGNLPAPMQAKLLRVLQERQVLPVGAGRPLALNVRFVAASNIMLEQATRNGEFREDLFYRLAEYVITVPPLRERREDVALLAEAFLQQAAVAFRKPVSGFEAEALESLVAHDWPGNVRQLRNVVRRAVLQCDRFLVRADQVRPLLAGDVHATEGPSRAIGFVKDELHVPAPEPETGPLRDIVARATETVERAAISGALRRSKGNKAQAARMLHVDYKTLYLKIRRLGLEVVRD